MPVGLLALVGTSWYGHRIATDFYNPFTPTNSRSVTVSKYKHVFGRIYHYNTITPYST